MKQFKKIAIIISIATIILVLASCATNQASTLNPGQYVIKGEKSIFDLKVEIFESGEFTFHFSMLSSYFPHGKWNVKGNRLELKTDDGMNIYMFDIDGDNLIFDQPNSSEIKQYQGDTILNDKDVFKLEATS